MVCGQRAFKGDSSIETMNAILKAEPPEISASGTPVNPGLERIIRRCLEKAPERRFQSAGDLAFAIEALSSASSNNMQAAAPAVQGRARWEVPARVERLDLSTGKRALVRELAPASRAGVLDVRYVACSQDERSYAYTFNRLRCRLSSVTGVK